MTQIIDVEQIDQLHPLATTASSAFLEGGRAFTPSALAELESALAKIASEPELGPAIASLVQVAQFLEYGEKNKQASRALLQVVLTQVDALEALNQQGKNAAEDKARAKGKAFAKFSGRA